MAFPIVFTKQLGAASSNSIAQSQTPGSAALILNGSASSRLSTTTTSAVAVGGVFLPLASTTGAFVGQGVTDSTVVTLPPGTKVTGVATTGVTIWPPVGGVNGVGNGDTIVLAGVATIDTATAANSAIGRRVIITSGGNDTGINWTVVGTNAAGNAITDTFAGASGGAAQSNLDFVTVTSITPSGAVASTALAGTNGVGASPWITLNWHATSVMNVGFNVELVSGSVNYTVQHTYDDPNNLLNGATYPLATDNSVVAGAAASADGSYTTPIAAIRVQINSGTGELRGRFLQSSIG